MRILKILLLGILAIVALLLVISFFLPSKWHVERSIVINAPAENAFDQVNNLKNWDKWSPWMKMDTTMKVTYSGPEEGVGASYSWEGDPKKTGKGKLTISESRPNEYVKTDLDFGEGGLGTGGFKFEPADGGTKVSWSMDSDLGMNPIARYMGIIMTGMMEGIFDQGLGDIKKIAEEMPPPSKAPEMTIEETKVSAMNYLFIHDHADTSNIGQKIGAAYGRIQEAMKKQGLNMSGYPFAIYYTESTSEWDVDFAIGTDKAGKADGDIKPGTIKEGNTVVAHYYGPYEKMAPAYEALKKYIADNGKKITGAPWEIYITDPMTEKDPMKWQTDIHFPVE